MFFFQSNDAVIMESKRCLPFTRMAKNKISVVIQHLRLTCEEHDLVESVECTWSSGPLQVHSDISVLVLRSWRRATLMLIQCHRNEKEVFCGALGKSTGAMAPVPTEHASSGTMLYARTKSAAFTKT